MSGNACTSTPKAKNDKTLIQILIIAALCLAAYAPSLDNGFTFDDNNQIVHNHWITSTTYITDILTQNVAGFDRKSTSNYYRPMMHITNIIHYATFGLNPRGYHLTNMLLHCATSMLILLLATKIIPPQKGPQKWLTPPFVAALIFALHPIHTEAVMWISALPDVACAFLYLSSFHLYISSTGNKKALNIPYATSIALFALALLYKETAITLIPLLIIYDITTQTDTNRFSIQFYKRHLPYLLVAAAYMALRINALNGIAPSRRFSYLTPIQHIYNSIALLAQHIEKTLMPTDLHIYYSFNPITALSQALLPATAVILPLAAFMVLRTRNNAKITSLALYLLPLLPALYMPALGETPFAERYLYLPSAGFAIMAAMTIAIPAPAKIQRAANILILGILTAYAAGIINRTPAWATDTTLWTDTIKYSPQSATPHRYLAYALNESGNTDDAITEYKKSIEIEPKDPYAHLNLGAAYHKAQRFNSAIWEYHMAIYYKPDLYEAYANLGTAYAATGQNQLAIETCDIALQIFPDDAGAHECKGIAYGNIGAIQEAIRELDMALRLAPDNSNCQQNLAKARQIARQSDH